MADPGTNDFEDNLIADMRAHDGAVTAGPLAGHPLLIMTSTGARTGAPRRAVLTWSRDGGDYVVAGTAGGSTREPRWVRNVALQPTVSIETGNTIFEATARVIADGPERDRLWDHHVVTLPHFAGYPATARRTIPMVRLTPVI